MTLCREWSLVKSSPEGAYGKPLLCRSWSCEMCRPNRRSQLLARAASGAPTKLITLTVNPRNGSDPAERLRMLSHAWNVIVKRLRRAHPDEDIEYLAVVEETARGEPHLHILARAPFVPVRQLSAWMDGLTGSPVVDVRKVKDLGKAVAYVAKYIAKAPAQFGNAKRYWSSKGYEIPDEDFEPFVPMPEVRWQVFRESLTSIINTWIHDGWVARRFAGEIVVAFHPERGPP